MVMIMNQIKSYVPDLSYIATIGWQKNLSEDYYAFGYIASFKDAGDILVEQKVPDLFIYPIMFCYRQYLELILKNVYFRRKTTEEYTDFIKKVSHDLCKSWDNVKLLLINDLKKKHIDFIEYVVMYFNKLDPSSYTFRYEYNKEMERNIDDKYIDTKKVKKSIKKIDDILRYTYDDE